MSDEKRRKRALPVTGFLRLPQIVGAPDADPPIPALKPIARSTWWQGVKEGRFPQPVKSGPRTTVWRAEDIYEFIMDPEGYKPK